MSSFRLRFLHKGAPVISGVPVPTGSARFVQSPINPTAVTAPVAGQRLFIDPGSFTNTPTSYDYTIYSAGVAVETGTFTSAYDAYWIVPDSSLSEALQVKCHGINGTGTSATTSDSVATSAVVQIDFSDNTPTFARTSSSGVTPMTGSFSFGASGTADVLAGKQVLFQVFANAVNAESGSSVTRECHLVLQETDLPSLDIASFNSRGMVSIGSDPWTAMTATEYGRVRLQTVGELGSFFSGYSSVFGPTNYTGAAVTDNFDDNSKNTSLWGADGPFVAGLSTGGTVVETSSRTIITPPSGAAGYTGRISANAASFIGKQVVIERLTTDFNSTENYMKVGPDATSGYGYYSSGGNIFLFAWNSSGSRTTIGSFADPDTSGAANTPTTFRWIRLRHDNATDTIKLDTAPSSASIPPTSGQWTNRISAARSDTYWNKTTTPNLKVGFGGGQYGSVAAPNEIPFNTFDTDMAL